MQRQNLLNTLYSNMMQQHNSEDSTLFDPTRAVLANQQKIVSESKKPI